MNQIKAENLLSGSDILTQIAELRESVRMPSEGQKLSFDDYFAWLQEEGTKIPRIELLKTVPARQEGNYTVQLIEALDQVQEKIAFVYNKLITFQTRLIEVDTAIKTAAGTFEAWYLLALDEHLSHTELKLPQTARKGLATSEFNRLMSGAPVAVLTLQVAVKAEIVHLDAKKKMAREKFDRGREQINASFMSQLPGNLGVSADPGSLRVLQDTTEDEEEMVPTFVSQRQRVAPSVDQSDNVCDVNECGAPATIESGTFAISSTAYVAETVAGGALIGQAVETSANDAPESLPVSVIAAQKGEETAAALPIESVVSEEGIAEFQDEHDPIALARVKSQQRLQAQKTLGIESGFDLGSGPDKTVAAIRHIDDEGKTISREDEVFLAATDSTFVEEMKTISREVQTGFFKTGTPAPATEISPAQAVVLFAEDDETGDEDLKELVAETVESEYEDVISAEPAVNSPSNLRTEASNTPKPPTKFEEFADDELEDLTPRTKVTVAVTPVPEPVVEMKPAPASQPTTQRKKLAFVFEDED
jgi:hypothetical protein